MGRDIQRSKSQHKEMRLFYKSHGICPECGQRDSMPGYILCAVCRRNKDKYRKRRDPDGTKHISYLKQLRDERRQNGLCIDCGNPVLAGFVRCKQCLENNRERMQIVRIRRRIKKQNERELEALRHAGNR